MASSTSEQPEQSSRGGGRIKTHSGSQLTEGQS